MNKDDMISLLKAGAWEQAKGHLRAVVAIGGQCSPMDEHRCEQYTKLGEKVEKFIKDVEDWALQE